MLSLTVLTLCVFVVLVCCAFLVFHPNYQLGPVGTLGLTLLGLAAASRFEHLMEAVIDGGTVAPSPKAILAWFGSALFFGQLTWRFVRRCKRKPRLAG
jgi:hypothetical protein